MIIEVITAFGMVTVSGEIGEGFSNWFNEIETVIIEFDWYTFPIELQRILPFIWMNVQRVVGIECFGSILCSRQTLKNVRFNKIRQPIFIKLSNIEYSISGDQYCFLIFYGSPRI